MNPSVAPVLPAYALLPSLALYGILIVLLAVRSRSASSAFVVVAIAARLAMSAMPHFSFSASPLGLSWNALVSCLVIGAGLLLIRRGRAAALIALPTALIMAVIALSGAMNHQIGQSIEPLVKFGYFMVVGIAVADAFRAEGPSAVLGRLLWVMVLPFVLQLESVALGVVKATETDGSASYIGGYNHEASFSLLLVSALVAVALHQRLRPRAQIALVLLCMGGIFLANYRTAIAAMAPLIVGVLLTGALRSVLPSQRIFAAAGAALMVLAAVPAVTAAVGDRFDTLGVVAADPMLPFKEPNAFTDEDKKVMSGRVYLWSEYLAAWRSGSDRQHLLGYGANAWEGQFRYYAHNTLVSTLYELGYLGVAAMLVLWAWMMWLAICCAPPLRLVLVTAHAGFILLNMATMPFWMVEGLLLYALLCGATVHAYTSARPAGGRTRRPGGQPLPAKLTPVYQRRLDGLNQPLA